MTAPAGNESRQHRALLYSHEAEYLTAVSEFVHAALTRGERVLVMVPGGRARPLQEALGPDSPRVFFADMATAGRNPARLIPLFREFADSHPGGPVSLVGESAWPARSPRELLTVAKHEALLNLAFTGKPMSILCPYNQAALPAETLATAMQTHPLLIQAGRHTASTAYPGPGQMPPSCLQPLPPPPPRTETLRYRTSLAPVRELIGRRAARAGLPEDRASDLVIAVSELAANTLRHTSHSGTVRVWEQPGELVCEVCDRGWITDPLAGRHGLLDDNPGGSGLWVVNQVCDLVEMRTSPSGTTTRLHMTSRADGHSRVPAAPPPA